jgi:tetratricopeptide (TPR) repeat protein
VVDIGFADLFMGHYPEAARMLEKHLGAYPNSLGAHVLLSIAYSELGRNGDARAQAAEILRLNPQYKFIPPGKWVPKLLASRFDEDLRKAGLIPCVSNSPQVGYAACRD